MYFSHNPNLKINHQLGQHVNQSYVSIVLDVIRETVKGHQQYLLLEINYKNFVISNYFN